jgi:bisphosphoglycerate-independent phosphoglycerate mutase (AlkP superfamily)
LGDGIRPDVVTYYLAKEYLKIYRPKVLYIAFDETDDWAHNGKYAEYLDAALFTDKWIEDIWNTVQSMPEYKGKTTLLITTDHGRGDKIKKQWKDHGDKIEDAYQIWFAAMGPGIQALGEVKTPGQLYQKQVAATVAKLLGLNFTSNHPVAEPIPGVLKK